MQAWLESLPHETEAERETARRWAVTIAHRAAMRELPNRLVDDLKYNQNAKDEMTAALWPLLASCVAASGRKVDWSKHADLNLVF
ncbi:hypothetical protein [Roseinatronobacter ekhonensis]|uniref:hypothetical protein n=1 Tax=Roseinatronobacter ekhonensis TaxID=254356 RepID=UPI0011C3E827|nr:hypothetical protein [Roseibaca ekhonensis]